MARIKGLGDRVRWLGPSRGSDTLECVRCARFGWARWKLGERLLDAEGMDYADAR